MISPFSQENSFEIILKFGKYEEKIENDSLEYATTGILAELSANGILKYQLFDEHSSSLKEVAFAARFWPS